MLPYLPRLSPKLSTTLTTCPQTRTLQNLCIADRSSLTLKEPVRVPHKFHPRTQTVNFWGSMMINGSIWLKPQVPCQANNWSNQPGIPPAPQRLGAVQPLSFPPPAAASPRHPGGMMIPGLLVCAALRILNIAWPWLNYIYIYIRKCII